MTARTRTGILAALIVGTTSIATGGTAAIAAWFVYRTPAGGTVDVAGSPLRWSAPVTEAEAVRLARYLEAQSPERGAGYGMEVRRSGRTYELHLAVKVGLDRDESYLWRVRGFARQLSRDVFAGAKVDIHLCDSDMRTVRVVVAFD